MAKQTFEQVTIGEVTGVQAKVASATSGSRGYQAPEPATFDTWRAMRRDSAIAIARVAAYCAVKASKWRIRAEDGLPEDLSKFVGCQIDNLRRPYLRDVRFSLDHGFQPFEKIWMYDESEGPTRIVIDQLKGLIPDNVKINTLETTGGFGGITQGDITLGLNKCFVFTNDYENGNFYGSPRHENCRREWSYKKQTLERMGVLVNKVTGTVPILQYPTGVGEDATGAKVDNFQIAVAMLRSLSQGVGVALPNTLAKHLESMINRGVDPKSLRSWILEFAETASGHAAEIVGVCEYFDKALVRGWLVPERAITEATIGGSRADSGAAIDIAIAVQEDLSEDIAESITMNVARPLVRLNFGRQYERKIRVEYLPLDDKEKAVVRDVVKTVISDPANLPLVMEMLDFDSMIDQVGLPRAHERAQENRDKAAGDAQDFADGLRKALTGDRGAPVMPGDQNAGEGNPTPAASTGKPETPAAGVPAGTGTETPAPAADQSGAVATNDLRATVGGSQQILALQQAYYAGDIPRDAAIANATIVFGFKADEAEKLFPAIAPDAPEDPNKPKLPPGMNPGKPAAAQPADDSGDAGSEGDAGDAGEDAKEGNPS